MKTVRLLIIAMITACLMNTAQASAYTDAITTIGRMANAIYNLNQAMGFLDEVSDLEDLAPQEVLDQYTEPQILEVKENAHDMLEELQDQKELISSITLEDVTPADLVDCETRRDNLDLYKQKQGKWNEAIEYTQTLQMAMPDIKNQSEQNSVRATGGAVYFENLLENMGGPFAALTGGTAVLASFLASSEQLRSLSGKFDDIATTAGGLQSSAEASEETAIINRDLFYDLQDLSECEG